MASPDMWGTQSGGADLDRSNRLVSLWQLGFPERTGDVLEEHEGGPCLSNDSEHLGNKVSCNSPSVGGRRERLARCASHEEINEPPPGSSVEGCEVVPYWSVVDMSVRLPGEQHLDGFCVLLDVADGSGEAPGCEADAEFNPANPGTKREDVEPGTCSHIRASHR